MSKNTLLVFGNIKSEYLTGLKENYEVRNIDSQSRTGDKDFSSEQASCFFIDGDTLSDQTFSQKIKSAIEQVDSPSVILENCKSSDLTDLIGIGFDANLVFVKRLDENNVVIEILEPSSESIKGSESDEKRMNFDELPEEIKKKIEEITKNAETQSKSEPEDNYEEPSEEKIREQNALKEGSITVKFDVEKHRQGLSKRIEELLSGNFQDEEIKNLSRASASSPQKIPPRTYKNFNLTSGHLYVDLWWGSSTKVQTSFLAVAIRIQLVAVDNENGSAKYCGITQTGAGVSPGNMYKDDRWTRIFYQDEIKIKYGPQSRQAELYIDKYAPQNENSVTTVSTTTGFTVSAGVSADGPNAGISYESSTTLQTNIWDFSIESKTNSNEFYSNYYLTKRRTGSFFVGELPEGWPESYEYFNFPFSHKPPFRWGVLQEIPTLGKITFPIKSECVWKADLSFRKRVKYEFEVAQRLTGVESFGVQPTDFFFRPTRSFWYQTLEIDFGAVSP
jgi:hypothetical protein